VADTLALEQLYTRVCAALPSIQQPFGWREKLRHGQTTRIVWQPGDPMGAIGKIGGAKWPGRLPSRPLASLAELFTVWISGYDPSNPRSEMHQYKATRLIFDDWYREVYKAARGTFQIVSTSWEIEHNEGKFGGCIRVVATIDAMIPDTQRERAPLDVGAIITPRLFDPSQDSTEQDIHYTADPSMLVLPAESTIDLWALDNSPYPAFGLPSVPVKQNACELWGYSTAQLRQATYSGPPAHLIRLPAGAGRGHGFTVLPSGQMIVATSENVDGNAYESWFLVPADAKGDLTHEQCPRIRCIDLLGGAQGARQAILLGDGTILLGTNGIWRQVPLEAFYWPVADLASLPMWTLSPEPGGYYDHAVVPGTRQVEFEGGDKVFQVDFSQPAGAIPPSSLKLFAGSNIGAPLVQAWGGYIALDASGGLWRQRGDLERIYWWSAATLAARTSGGTNPPPDKILTCPLITALDINAAGIGFGMDLESDGGMWIRTNRWNVPTDGIAPLLMHFSAAAVAAGGDQLPDRVIELPAVEQSFAIRSAQHKRLYAR
jgi:hypothetical protein